MHICNLTSDFHQIPTYIKCQTSQILRPRLAEGIRICLIFCSFLYVGNRWPHRKFHKMKNVERREDLGSAERFARQRHPQKNLKPFCPTVEELWPF